MSIDSNIYCFCATNIDILTEPRLEFSWLEDQKKYSKKGLNYIALFT
jgi:hypothetical protein